MKNRIVSIGAVILLFPLTSTWAVDLTGNWIAKIPNYPGIAVTASNHEADGEKMAFATKPYFIEVVFCFKEVGDKLTGKITDPEGDATISDGKIDGDDISFIVKRGIDGEQVTQRCKGIIAGRVYGDAIELTCKVEGGKGESYEFIAKREFPLGDYYLPDSKKFPPPRPIN